MKRPNLLFAFVALFSAAWMPLGAQVYGVGDVVDDFELIDRATGQPARLSDFEGRIILLEWFAVWCPFCQAAAPEIETGILQHYGSRNGNPDGLPVVRIGVNLQADGTRWGPSTNAFIAEHNLTPTLEDNSRELARKFFFNSSGQPLFAIINGVADSSSHAQWELLYKRNGYLSTDTPIEDFRSAIDAVAAPLPEPPTAVKLISQHISSEGLLRLRIEGNRRDEIFLRRSDDLVTWTPLDLPIPAEETTVLELGLAALAGDRFVQAVRTE